MNKLLFATLLVACQTTSAAGNTFVADPTRTVYIDGEINGGALKTATQIVKLADADNGPIDIVINSPGGSVVAGLQIIDAMAMAQSRGVVFRCVVPMLAASMAFQVLANCDERYALRYSLLLWHPVKEMLQAPATADDLLYAGDRIKLLEQPLMEFLLLKLKISRKVFEYHYHHETLWTASQLRVISPGFVTIVTDLRNVKNPFNVQ